MSLCPLCKENTIPAGRKLFLSPAACIRCETCNGEVGLSPWAVLGPLPLLFWMAAAYFLINSVSAILLGALFLVAIALVPFLNLAVFRLVPFCPVRVVTVRALSLTLTVLTAAAAVPVGLAVARATPRPHSLPLQCETAHFSISSNLGKEALERHARFVEGFREFFEARYFPLSPRERARVFLFADEPTYAEYVRTHFRGYSEFGFYDAPSRLIVVNCGSGVGTLAHMLVRHFVRTSFAAPPPPWIEAGFAAFFEKFLAHIEADGRLVMSVGYFSEWRFSQVKSYARQLSLPALASAADPDQNAAAALMLFLHKRGCLERFINAARTARSGTDCLALLENFSGMSTASLEREWKEWIETQPLDGNVRLVEQSLILSANEWQRWLARHGEVLHWSEAEQTHRVGRASTTDATPMPVDLHLERDTRVEANDPRRTGNGAQR